MISSIPKWVSSLFGNTIRPNVKVAEINYISPQIKKVRFKGDISKWNCQIGYASVIRVSETEFRNYTIAYHDKKNEIFDIIFHLHGNGVGTQYIDRLQTNDELFISPPRGKKLYDPGVQQQVVFGDETSLGVACALLPLLKKHHHPFQYYFELDELNKNVPELLGLVNVTVFPKNQSFRNEKWITEWSIFQLPDWKEASFILTGNVQSIQTFRKVLKRNTKGNIYSQGYWLEGKKGL